MPKLMQVRERCILVWPNAFESDSPYRGGPGYVVDLEAPCEAEWCGWQEEKLEPAAKDAKADEIKHPRARMKIAAEVEKSAAPVVAPAKPPAEKPEGVTRITRTPAGAT